MDFSYNHFTSRRKEVKPLTEGGRTALLLFVTAAAASDLRWGRIYNFLTLTSLAGGIWLLTVQAPQEVPGVLGAMALLFCFLFPFWKIGGLGAGDIKMLLALVPYMGVRWFYVSFILSFLIGAVIAAFLLVRYRDGSRTVHFAVPIGISVVLCLLLEQISVQSPFLM
jgi:prepilin peptidase CpaA